MIELRAARPDDFAVLTDLCLRSKAHWGYDNAFMAACRKEMTIGPDDLARGGMVVIEDGGHPVGTAHVTLEGDVADLDFLYIDPGYMGRGHGRRLFRWAVSEARERGATALRIDSDPNAQPFYERMGAHLIGEAPSGSIPGRMLPLLEMDLV